MGEAFLIALMLFALGGGDDDDVPPPGDDDPNKPGRDLPPPPGGDDPNKPGRDLPDVDDPDEPPPPPRATGELADIRVTYPEAGRVYQVVSGDTGALSAANNGIAHRAIATTMYREAMRRGLSHADALGIASSSAQSHRTKYWLAIEGDAWNDRLYGTFGYGPQAMPNPATKRAIRLLPQNADNVARLAAKQAPIRSILLSTPNNAKQGTGKAAPGAPSGHFELLWLPAINVQAMWDGQLVVDISGPPQWVRALGVIDRSGAPAGTKWGA